MKKFLIIIGFLLVNAAAIAQTKTCSQNACDKVVVYPDETGNIINIEIKDPKEKVVFHMYNKSGKEVTNKVSFVSTSAFKKQMDITNLKPGVYFMWYHVTDAYLVNKVIKS